MIKPINGHVLIEPVKHESFMATKKETYQEIGVVIETEEGYPTIGEKYKGKKVLFDAWLAKKYPKEGSTDEYYWLVRYSDIVAYDTEAGDVYEQCEHEKNGALMGCYLDCPKPNSQEKGLCHCHCKKHE